MYERSAIVLERYIDKLLDYSKSYNLKINFINYCNLVEKLDKYQENYQKEFEALKLYNESIEQIKEIQLAEKELYKNSAKLEYDRNILFKNIDSDVNEISRVFDNIYEEVLKNNELMKEQKDKLINVLNIYNNRKAELSKCKRYKKIAENEYNDVYQVAKEVFDNISTDTLTKAKSFAKFEDYSEIVEQLEENGVNEKIPFNEGIIESAVNFSFDIAKQEILSYLLIYEKMNKLLLDIEAGTARINIHKKYSRNEKAKIDFIFCEKNYIIQYLDYERMTTIYGRKSHNRLMQEAVTNFESDINQISNLYELLLKEISNKATKKSYKDLYNKSYLIDMKEKEEKFRHEKTKVNLNAAALINTNYWRIDGIREIYQIFYKNVSEVFGKDIREFDLSPNFYDDKDDEQDGTDDNDDSIEFETKIPFELNIEDKDVNIIEDEEDDDSYLDNIDKILLEKKNVKHSVPNPVKKEEIVEEKIEEDVSEDEFENIENSNLSVPFKTYEYDEEEEEEEEEEYEDDYSNETENALDVTVNKEKSSDEFDIFGDKYKTIDFTENNFLNDVTSSKNFKSVNSDITNKNIEKSIEKNEKIANSKSAYKKAYFSDDIDSNDEEEDDDDEDSLLKSVKNERKNSKFVDVDLDDDYEEMPKKKGIFGRLKKSKKKNIDDDIWD